MYISYANTTVSGNLIFMSTPINDIDFIRWGKVVFEKAKQIYSLELLHKRKVISILEDIYFKDGIPIQEREDCDYARIEDIEFTSYMLKGVSPGHAEVKDYWLNYIVNKLSDTKSSTWEESVKKIIDGVLTPFIIQTFNKRDFDKEGRFRLTVSSDDFQGLHLTVPYTLDHLNIEFAIKIIQEITTSEVNSISLWYFTHDVCDGSMFKEVSIAVDDKDLGDAPYISKADFLNMKFEKNKRWFLQIPDFAEYVKQIEREENQ
jgi:hypothetical protein